MRQASMDAGTYVAWKEALVGNLATSISHEVSGVLVLPYCSRMKAPVPRPSKLAAYVVYLEDREDAT